MKIKEFVQEIRGQLTAEQCAAARRASAFFLGISAPRKSSHSLAGWEVDQGLFLALLGGVDIPPSLWRGQGWSRASRAREWAEENLLPTLGEQYPRTKADVEDLLHYHSLEGHLVEFARWLYHNS